MHGPSMKDLTARSSVKTIGYLLTTTLSDSLVMDNNSVNWQALNKFLKEKKREGAYSRRIASNFVQKAARRIKGLQSSPQNRVAGVHDPFHPRPFTCCADAAIAIIVT